jgi:TrmH family RNA methyltransferase
VGHISSRQNPTVRVFRELAESPAADGTRLLLDGIHLIQEARAAGLVFERAAVVAGHADDGSEIAETVAALVGDGVDVSIVTQPVMKAISPVRTPSGVAAIVRRQPVSAVQVCQHRNAFVVAAVDVQDPGNLGALLRAAEAGGATSAVTCGTSASPFSWKAVRGSMGTILRLPIVGGMQAEALLTCAQKFGLRTIASVPRGGEAPEAIDWRGGVVLFVGGEGPGLDDNIVAASDARVTIPMRPPVESLNVAVAGGLLVYEARRQRT